MQEFYVLKCHSCELYQVHIVKKAKKWACKVCGAKQSVVKIYGQGSAKDCRLHVQKLNDHSQNFNAEREQITYDNFVSHTAGKNMDYDFHELPLEVSVEEEYEENASLETIEKPKSKWQKYIEPEKVSKADLPKSGRVQSCDSISPNEFYETYDEPKSKRSCTPKSNINGPNFEQNTKMDLKSNDYKVLQFFDVNELDVDDVLDL